MLDRVELTGRIRVSPARAEVHFTIVNRGSRNIFLIDVAFRVSAKGEEVRPDHLLVSFEPPATAVLSSKLLPLDPKIAWATPPVAYATRVASGATHVGDVGASVPLRVQAPFPPAPAGGGPAGFREVSCDRIRFELGIIPESAELKAQPRSMAGRDVYELSALAWKRQEILSVESRDVPVTLGVPR